MPLVPEAPFPKEKGQPLRSRDWNQLVTEVQRLDTDKVNKLIGDSIKGPLTIDSSLGIGVTVPKAPLHLAGMNWDVNTSEGDLRIGSDTHRLKIGVAIAGGGAGDVRIRAMGGTNRLMLGSNTEDLLTIQNGAIAVNAALGVANNQALSFGAQVRQMINLWNADYGIGVQANTQYFRTASNFAWFRGGSHSDAAITTGSGGTLQMCITGTDRVGINTNNPQGRLHVASADWNSNSLRISGLAGNVVGPSLDLDATAASGGRHYSIISTGVNASPGAGCFSVYDNAGVYRLVINANGNVGIGTTSPDAKLDVSGAIHAGGSDIYFTETTHTHTGIGNATGYAAIENAANYGALMILGRSVGNPMRRIVGLWDELNVHGNLKVRSGQERIEFGVGSGPYGGDGIRGYPNLWLDAQSRVFIKAGFGTSAMDVAERFKAFQILELGEVV
ncbi:MAG: hypothetical protein VKJ24_21795, partial [Synechococcales bacterium]|nr:hypothetical protein [Synechococcales bacterium]